jgi:hypothetical protein
MGERDRRSENPQNQERKRAAEVDHDTTRMPLGTHVKTASPTSPM